MIRHIRQSSSGSCLVGGRPLRLEHLELRCLLDGDATLVDDLFDVKENGPQVAFDVLANDVFESEYGGPQLITSVSYGSEGGRIAIAADRRGILYTPPADFFGVETFVYAVDGQFTAQVQVDVQAPLAFDHFEVPPDGLVHDLLVMANDPFWAGYQGPRRITSVSVGSEGGTVVIAPGEQSILYTPPDGAFGKESFIYVVDGLYPAQVTIEIPKTLENDKFELIEHVPPQTFHVLANDPFWANYPGERRITHVTEAVQGTVEISNDGQSVIYTHTGGSGSDSFRYVVDGAYEATVSVRIYRPVRDDSFEVDQNSNGFFSNVTANDTYRDDQNVLHDVINVVTSVTQPESGGTVSITSNGQGIYYTPPEGFSGSDTFTYVADGVHEATVYVQVTRPVRNDSISSGIYQDTPNGVLNVLANDFLGNGYAGAKLITAVGPTQNGGLVTIRGDGKALVFTPAPGFTGSDQFTYMVDEELTADVSVYVRPLARSDNYRFAPDPDHGPYALYVLGNDYFGFGYSGPAVITSASVTSGGGQVSVADGFLSFQPGSAGSHLLSYTVDDKYEATVSVWIPNHLDPDRFVVDQNAPSQSLDVMANDFTPDPSYVEFKSQDYPGPRRITSARESQEGGVVTVATDGLSVYYEPPEDFYGADSFTYTVDGFMTTTATVQVIRRVRDDQFRVDAVDGPTALPVLVNDLFGADYVGPGQITAVTAPSAGGTATISADGRSILFTPESGFVGSDTFTYTVDGALKADVRVVVDAPADEQFPRFASFEEYTQFLIDDALVRYQYLFGQTVWDDLVLTDGAVPRGPAENNRGHSETNVQVAGVDEGDIVEFDSDFVYVLRDGEVVIVDAWPAEESTIASRMEIEGQALVEFLHGDRLTIISQTGGNFIYPEDQTVITDDLIGPFGPPWQLPTFEPFTTIVTVLDVSDREAPTVVQKTTMEGKYVDSRGVGDFVYVLVSNADAVGPQPEIVDEDNDPDTLNRYETAEEYLARVTANPGTFVEAALPNYSAFGSDGELVRTGLLNMPELIYRPLVTDATNLISVVSFDIEGDEPGLTDTSAVYSSGASTIYASLDNFYVFDADHSAEDGPTTRIAKFNWEPATGGIEFAATTTVPGAILNQFSADENGPYLRIATTVSNSYSGNWSGRRENMLFVLQEDDGVLESIGSLQNLALDESMQSVRFLGNRAFVSTFRNVDPLFAVDLSDPTQPEAVGHVTLPGYTSYMHLVDENHLLTVGRNTPVGFSGPTQVAMFDISDLTQPQRIAEYTFERFSTSEAEIDHHAFGFYEVFGLLAMPVGRVFYERVDNDGDGYREARQIVTEYELAVFTVDATASESEERLALAGAIEHDSIVRRSGYIGDKLYSVANDSVKVVDVTTPNDLIKEIVVAMDDEQTEGGGGSTLENPLTIGGRGSSLDDAQVETIEQQMAAAIDRARSDLAARLGSAAGAPMFVTAEATPDAPGGGHALVFLADGRQYLYRASSDGVVALADADFNFAVGATNAWHTVAFKIAPLPYTVPGDYNLDGRVDDEDIATWRANFGTVSITSFHAADGNRDGTVDTADYVVLRSNLGRVAGDYDGDKVVDDRDYSFWRTNFGATTGLGLAADGNGDGVVDLADYVFWRTRANITEETRALATAGTASGAVSASAPAGPTSDTTVDAAFSAGEFGSLPGNVLGYSRWNSITPVMRARHFRLESATLSDDPLALVARDSVSASTVAREDDLEDWDSAVNDRSGSNRADILDAALATSWSDARDCGARNWTTP